MSRPFDQIKSFIWWSHPRGSLQYDIMVGLILAFIFFTPRNVFRDQPQPLTVAVIGRQSGDMYEVAGSDDPNQIAAAIAHYTGHRVHLRRIQRALPGDSDAPPIYHVWTD
jgi:hypothetical protein